MSSINQQIAMPMPKTENGKYDYDVPLGGYIIAPYMPREFIDSTGRVFCQSGIVDESSLDLDFFDRRLNSPVFTLKHETNGTYESRILNIDETTALIVYRDTVNPGAKTFVRRIKPNSINLSAGMTDEDGAAIVKQFEYGTVSCTAYINGVILIGAAPGYVYYSTDKGKTWSTQITIGGASGRINSFSYVNGKYVAVVDTTTNNSFTQVYYSSTLTSWTLATNLSITGNGIVHGNNSTVVYQLGNNIKVSTNFTTWTSITTLPSQNIVDSVLFDSKIFLCGFDNFLYVSSDDGLTWTNLNTTPSLTTDSAYLRMFEYKDELFLYQCDAGITTRIFKILKGSNTLIPVTIENTTVKRTSYTKSPATNVSFYTNYNKFKLQQLKVGLPDTTSYIFYVGFSNNLILSRKFKFNNDNNNFERIYDVESSKILSIKVCDSTYIALYEDFIFATNSGFLNIYSDIYKTYTISIPSPSYAQGYANNGLTHMRTK